MKQAVESLCAPVKEKPKDVTTKLKATVGELAYEQCFLVNKVWTKHHHQLLTPSASNDLNRACRGTALLSKTAWL